jgi:hypothetical protein
LLRAGVPGAEAEEPVEAAAVEEAA